MDWLRRRFRPSPAAPAPELPPAAQRLRAARAALHAGDGRAALRHIELGIAADPAYVPLYKLVTTTYALLPTGQEDWKLYAAAAERPDEAQPFLALGRHFIALSGQRIAVPLLERARALAPNDVAVARALAEALLGECRPRDARECLQSVDRAALEADPEARTVLARARLLCGETAGILEEAHGDTRDELAKALERRATVETPDESARSLRAWHFIQYGAALLHVSAAEGGRYDFVSLGEEDITHLVSRLQRLLEALERQPEVVVALPDTDSLRLAEIVSRQTGVPLDGLPSSMVNRSTRQMMEDVERERVLLARTHSLVVAADNRKLEAYPAYQQALPGQTLFALTHYWLGGASFTPDVSGLLCRAAVFPWTPVQKPVTPPSPASRLSAPDPPPRELKTRKVDPPTPAGVPAVDAAFEDALAFYRERRALLTGGARGQRRPFRRESPVQGAYTS